MDLACRDKDNVTRRQMVGLAFDNIVDIAIQKKDDFMEIMVMERNWLLVGQ